MKLAKKVQIEHPSVLDAANRLTAEGVARSATEAVEYLALKGVEAMARSGRKVRVAVATPCEQQQAAG